MSPYIGGVTLIVAVALLILLGRLSPLAYCAAALTGYLGAYIVIAAGSAAILITQIAALGPLTQFLHAAAASAYALIWITALAAAKPLAQEGLSWIATFTLRSRRLVLESVGFDFARPYVLAQQLWNRRGWKTNVYYSS